VNRKQRRRAEKAARRAGGAPASAVPGAPGAPAATADPGALFQAAHAAYQAGDLTTAERLCRDLIAAHPDAAVGHNLLGIVLCGAGRGEAGLSALDRAVDLAPDDAGFAANLGVALSGLGRTDAARRALERSLDLAPDQPRAWSNLGSVLRAEGRLDDARRAYEQATTRDPGFAEAWSNFGNVLSDLDDIPAAERALRTAVALNPDHAAAHNNLGTVERRLGRYGAAAACFGRALQLDPAYGEAMNNLAEVFRETARAADALTLYDAALERLAADAPERAGVESNRLYALNMTEDGAARTEALARAFAAGFDDPPRPAASSAEARALRVGFVSSDLRRHSVSYFLEPLWDALDPASVEVLAYPASPLADAVTERLRARAALWRPLVGLSDDAAARAIRADGCDVLIDLNGHTMGNRLGVFARRAAPAQATWLGYPNTTGLAQMDARLVDAVTDPPGAAQWHSERLIRLDRPFLCYRPPDDAPAVAARADDAPVTFGSFNNLAKVSAATLDLWSAVLRAVPESRLVMKTKPLADEGVRARVLDAFADRGVTADRLDLLGWITRGSPLAAYARIDVALDTVPYHGTTTTCEALWMGVPVVTRAGSVHAARVGAALLGACGLDDLAAETDDAFVRAAVALAADGARRAALRRSLRDTLRASALMDAPGFASAFETAMRSLHRSVLDGAAANG
jgi:protein O-GlcNAc transferase